MNFSKLSLLTLFSVLAFASLALAKEEQKAGEETIAAVAGEVGAEEANVLNEGMKEDGDNDASQESMSDFDIEQLLKLIEALKNQDFDKVDETIKQAQDSKKDSTPGAEEPKKSESQESSKKSDLSEDDVTSDEL